MVTYEVVGTLNHYQMVKKIWTLYTKRQWGYKNFSIISSSLVLVLALVLELELELALELELELELALEWLGSRGDGLVPRGGRVIGVRGGGLVGSGVVGWFGQVW